MFQRLPSALPGCVELQPRVLSDARGRFVKTFHAAAFQQLGLCDQFAESYYSVSQRGVIRGLHFQTPPMAHTKLVYCVAGAVLDVVVDLRVGSPTYGQHALFELSAEQGNSVYIPAGMAHGFYTRSEQATLVYQVSTVYAPQHDAGILWNSAGIAWPEDATPILSERDQQFPTLAAFVSPFRYVE